MSSLGIWGFPTTVVVMLYHPLHPKCLPLRKRWKADIQNLQTQGLTLEIMQPMSLGYKRAPVTSVHSSSLSLACDLYFKVTRQVGLGGGLESSPCFSNCAWAITLLWALWGLKKSDFFFKKQFCSWLCYILMWIILHITILNNLHSYVCCLRNINEQKPSLFTSAFLMPFLTVLTSCFLSCLLS